MHFKMLVSSRTDLDEFIELEISSSWISSISSRRRGVSRMADSLCTKEGGGAYINRCATLQQHLMLRILHLRTHPPSSAAVYSALRTLSFETSSIKSGLQRYEKVRGRTWSTYGERGPGLCWSLRRSELVDQVGRWTEPCVEKTFRCPSVSTMLTSCSFKAWIAFRRSHC